MGRRNHEKGPVGGTGRNVGHGLGVIEQKSPVLKNPIRARLQISTHPLSPEQIAEMQQFFSARPNKQYILPIGYDQENLIEL